MCRHIYDWNIVNCDVKQSIQLNSTQGIYLYILVSIGQGHNLSLSTLSFWHDNVSSIQRLIFIFHIKMQDVETMIHLYLYILGLKRQGYNWTLWTLWFRHDNASSFQHTAFIFLHILLMALFSWVQIFVFEQKLHIRVVQNPLPWHFLHNSYRE